MEKLVDEVNLLARSAANQGCDVVLEVYQSHVHVFQQLRPVSIGAKVAVERAGVWMRNKFNKVPEIKARRDINELDFSGKLLSRRDL